MGRSAFLQLPLLVKPGDAYSSFTKINLDLNAIQVAFERGKQAYATQNYNDAVNLFSEAITKLQFDLSVILLHRAATYEAQEDYDRAVKDGQQAELLGGKMALRPDPYVTQANALLLQGNNLCRAATIFKKAATNVPVTNPQHCQLTTQYQQIMNTIDQHNQWLVQLLPYEVLSSILSYLSLKERGKLALTCKFWFDYILHDWADMWDCINVTQDLRTCRGFHSLLESIPGNKVKRVVLHMVQSYPRHMDDNLGYNSMMVLKTMRERQWNQVETLDISEFNKKQLEGILLLNKHSLKVLKLSSDFKSIYRNGALTDGPKLCQKLELITARIPQQYVKIPAGLIPPFIPKSDFHLTTLEVSPDDSEPRNFIKLLKESSMLVSLKISNQQRIFSYWEILQMVHQHCPVLQFFHYTSKAEPSLTTYTRQTQQQHQNGNTKWLKELVLRFANTINEGNNHNSLEVDAQLKIIFCKAYMSLETLDLDTTSLECTASNNNSVATLAQLGAPQLKKLTVTSKLTTDSTNTSPVEVLAKLILASPVLQEVNLIGKNLWNQEIFEALSTCTELRRVSTTDRDNLSLKERKRQMQNSIFTESIIAPLFSNLNIYNYVYDYQIDDTPVSKVQQQHQLLLSIVLPSFVVGLTKLVGNSKIRHFELDCIRLSNSILLEVLKNLRYSQVRHLKIRIDCQILGEEELEAFAAIEHLEYLFVYDDSSGGGVFDKSTLYKLFQKRIKKDDRLLVVHIQYSESVCDYLTGCKRDPIFIPKGDYESLDEQYLIKDHRNVLSRLSH
ncbi:hypothetical protein BDC45DRAFT_510734 [Circinella umbellata]|nr:hypothetical protein BDC45DRAFT_510734 [Circinella umbellata]